MVGGANTGKFVQKESTPEDTEVGGVNIDA